MLGAVVASVVAVGLLDEALFVPPQAVTNTDNNIMSARMGKRVFLFSMINLPIYMYQQIIMRIIIIIIFNLNFIKS